MRVSDIYELKVMAVLERGIANKECIAIQAKQTINLGQYGIMLGQFSGDNGVFPFRDNMFWFGDGIISEGDWILIYTGSGTPTTNKSVDNIHNTYTVFWGRTHTLFADSNVVPLLFRVDAVDIPIPPSNTPQLGNQNA